MLAQALQDTAGVPALTARLAATHLARTGCWRWTTSGAWTADGPRTSATRRRWPTPSMPSRCCRRGWRGVCDAGGPRGLFTIPAAPQRPVRIPVGAGLRSRRAAVPPGQPPQAGATAPRGRRRTFCSAGPARYGAGMCSHVCALLGAKSSATVLPVPSQWPQCRAAWPSDLPGFPPPVRMRSRRPGHFGESTRPGDSLTAQLRRSYCRLTDRPVRPGHSPSPLPLPRCSPTQEFSHVQPTVHRHLDIIEGEFLALLGTWQRIALAPARPATQDSSPGRIALRPRPEAPA